MVRSLGTSAMQSLLLQNYARANSILNRATERLSTGLRIKHASGNPAGLIAAVKLKSDLLDLSARTRVNELRRGQNRIHQSGLQAKSRVLQELRGLAVQAGGNTSSPDYRNAIQLQADASIDALGLIASTRGESLPPSLVNLRSGGSASLADGNVADCNVAEAVTLLDQEIADNNSSRMAAGVYEKYTLDVEQRLAEAQAVATASSLSYIKDADYARESSNLIISVILAKATLRTSAPSQRTQLQQAFAMFDNLF